MDQSNQPQPPAGPPPAPYPSADAPAGPPPGSYPPAGPPPSGSPPYPGEPWAVPPAPLGPAPGVQFAGHGARLGAYILDAILVGVAMTALIFVVAIPLFGSVALIDWNADQVSSDDAAAVVATTGFFIIASLVIGLVGMLYFPFFWARGGQTLGMKVAGIRVVNDRDGSRIGWGAALLRLVGYWVSAAVFYLGFVWILVDARRRGWHDLIAGTCVISSR